MNFDFKDTVKLIAAASAFVIAFFINLHIFYQLLIVFALTDILVGFLAGGKEGKLSSTISFQGMRKKAIMFILVGLSEFIGKSVGVPIGIAVASFYMTSEGLSIIENSIAAGLPVPDILKNTIAQFSKKESV